MANFSQGDIVRVPFPYTDRNTRQYRPALVISKRQIGEHGALIWVAMITSADNHEWPGDVLIERFERAGLPARSIIRTAKVATIEIRNADKIGKVEKPTLSDVIQLVHRNLFGEASD